MKILTCCILFLLSCSYLRISNPTKSDKRIVGRWCLTTNQTNYPSITFRNDSLSIFDSRGDTIYWFKYYVSNSVLWLIQPNGELNGNRIMKLSKDSLIFETLLEHQVKQSYFKCDNMH